MKPIETLGARIAQHLSNLDNLVKDYDLVHEVLREYEWALEEADKECTLKDQRIEALQDEVLELRTQLSLMSHD